MCICVYVYVYECLCLCFHIERECICLFIITNRKISYKMSHYDGHIQVPAVVVLISLLSTLSNMVTAYFALHMAVYLRPYHDSIIYIKTIMCFLYQTTGSRRNILKRGGVSLIASPSARVTTSKT